SHPNDVKTTTNIPVLVNSTHHVTTIVGNGQIDVSIDGTSVLTTTVTLPPQILLGFTAGTGGLNDRHAISNVYVSGTAGPTPPPPSGPVNDPSKGGWQLNGAASIVGTQLQLTPNSASSAGSGFWPTALSSSAVTVDF